MAWASLLCQPEGPLAFSPALSPPQKGVPCAPCAALHLLLPLPSPLQFHLYLNEFVGMDPILVGAYAGGFVLRFFGRDAASPHSNLNAHTYHVSAEPGDEAIGPHTMWGHAPVASHTPPLIMLRPLAPFV